MRHDPHSALDRWLAAERDGRPEADAAAEAALLELFESLPLLAPPAGFADRVLARTGLAAVRRSAFASRGLRAVVALCLVAVGLGAIWLPPVLRALAGLLTLSDLVQLGVRAVAEGSRALADLLRFGDWLFSLGRAVTGPLTTPPFMAMLGLCLLAAALSFRFLRDQISGERNWTYVERT